MSTPPEWRTRPETDGDREAVRALHREAFPTLAEAALVDALRADHDAWVPELSVVATTTDDEVVAHALLTRCHVGDRQALVLAPVATLPAYERQGAAAAAIRHALAAARVHVPEATVVLVLGDPEYYSRFGFRPADELGIRSPYDVPEGPASPHMALVLDPAEPVPSGRLRYPAAFDGLD